MPGEPAAVFAEPNRKSLVDQLVDSIAQTLLDGQFEPGAVLPAERDFAASLGVNRTSLRQALARLEQMGLVKSRHGIGTVVCDPSESTDTAVLGLLAGRHGSDLVKDVLDVRQVMSPLVARMAAGRAGELDIARLKEAVEDLRAASGARAAQLGEARFFDAVIDATRSTAVKFMWNALNAVYRSTLELFEDAYSDKDWLSGSLEEILQSIRSGDPDRAALAMASYSKDNALRMLGSFERHSPTSKP